MKYFELELIMTMYPKEKGAYTQCIDNHEKKDARMGIIAYTQNKEVLSSTGFLLIDKRYSLESSKSYNVKIRLAIDESKLSHIKLQNKIILCLGVNNYANAVICGIQEI